MKLQTLIIMRHGQVDRGGFLTDSARPSIESLGRIWHQLGVIAEKDTDFLCSDELRSIKTAHALMNGAGASHSVRYDEYSYPELFSLEKKCDVPGALRVLRKHLDGPKTVIVCTHYEMMTALPHAFGVDVLGTDSFPRYKFDYGQGLMIHCEEKTIKEIVYPAQPNY